MHENREISCTSWSTDQDRSAKAINQTVDMNVREKSDCAVLHYVFDLWVEAWRKKVAKGDVIVSATLTILRWVFNTGQTPRGS
jgi:hypothetical protein